MKKRESGFVRKELVEILRNERKDLADAAYSAAKELRKDLRIVFDRYAAYGNPEDQYVALVSIPDDLDAFMKAMKRVNGYLKENYDAYLTPYDDYLKTRGGQYALASQFIEVMDQVSFSSRNNAKAAAKEA